MKTLTYLFIITLLLTCGSLFATNITDTGKAPGPVTIKMNYAGTDTTGRRCDKERISFFAEGADYYSIEICGPPQTNSCYSSALYDPDYSKTYENLDEHANYHFQVTATNVHGDAKSKRITRFACTTNLLVTPNPTTDSIRVTSVFGKSFVFKNVTITRSNGVGYNPIVANIPFYSSKSTVVIYLRDYKIWEQGTYVITATDTSGRVEKAAVFFELE